MAIAWRIDYAPITLMISGTYFIVGHAYLCNKLRLKLTEYMIFVGTWWIGTALFLPVVRTDCRIFQRQQGVGAEQVTDSESNRANLVD